MIEEKLNQDIPEEVEIRENQDYDSEEEMTSETEETDDDESETNNTNVNNYLDCKYGDEFGNSKKKTCGLGTVEPQAT